MKKRLEGYIVMLVMALLMALNYEIFVFPNSFAPAGVNGIATMIQYKLNFSIGYMNLLLNVPLCIISFFVLKSDYAFKSLTFCLSFSAFALIFKYGIIDISPYRFITETGTSICLAPIAAGVVNGIIYGYSIKYNGSTGGTNIVGSIIHHNHPEKNITTIIFLLNASVAISSYFVYGYKMEPVICCLIYSFLTSMLSDKILRGGKSQVKFEIVTNEYEKMSKDIIEQTHHTATVTPAKGMYSGKETDLMICVVNKHQVVKLQKIIEKYPGSFAYLSNVNEIYGNYNKTGKLKIKKKS
ncbi:MAG: YitT family protein [Clostridia bacterium]|nr:YitT family protein [Clostridia bacterium]